MHSPTTCFVEIQFVVAHLPSLKYLFGLRDVGTVVLRWTGIDLYSRCYNGLVQIVFICMQYLRFHLHFIILYIYIEIFIPRLSTRSNSGHPFYNANFIFVFVCH